MAHRVTVREQMDEIAAKVEPRFPKVATMRSEAKEDVTAFAGFLLEPAAHGDDLVARDTQLGIRMVRRIRRRSASRLHGPRDVATRPAHLVGHRGLILRAPTRVSSGVRPAVSRPVCARSSL